MWCLSCSYSGSVGNSSHPALSDKRLHSKNGFLSGGKSARALCFVLAAPLTRSFRMPFDRAEQKNRENSYFDKKTSSFASMNGMGKFMKENFLEGAAAPEFARSCAANLRCPVSYKNHKLCLWANIARALIRKKEPPFAKIEAGNANRTTAKGGSSKWTKKVYHTPAGIANTI